MLCWKATVFRAWNMLKYNHMIMPHWMSELVSSIDRSSDSDDGDRWFKTNGESFFFFFWFLSLSLFLNSYFSYFVYFFNIKCNIWQNHSRYLKTIEFELLNGFQSQWYLQYLVVKDEACDKTIIIPFGFRYFQKTSCVRER